MTERDFSRLLQKYLAGKANSEEIGRIEKWYRSISDDPDIENDLNEGRRLQLWRHIQGKMHKRRSLSLWPRVGIAASLLIGLLSFLYFIQQDVFTVHDRQNGAVIANTTEKEQLVNLPDGSTVLLFPGSSIRQKGDFSGTSREIVLQGEAFFDIKPNPKAPFYVFSEQLVVKVLGTSFTVKAFPGRDISVAVKTGIVTVFEVADDDRSAEQAAVTLTPNQRVVYKLENRTINKMLVNEPEVIVSDEDFVRIYQFEQTSAVSVFKALEKLYGIEISVNENVFSNCIITTSGDTKNLFESLDTICEAIGATYHVEGLRVNIAGDGCD